MKLKQKQLVLLLSFFITVLISISNVNACTTLTNNTIINSDTTLCQGDYQFNDNDGDGIIKINSNPNLKLDCNGSYIHGSNSGIGILVQRNNITITNCNISNYAKGIRLVDSNNIIIINNTIKNNDESTLFDGGISITNSNISIINNTIEDNYRGINILSSHYTNITSNKIKKNNDNINLWANAISTLFEKNIIDPAEDLSGGTGTISIRNIFADWTAGPPSNFLADYNTITETLNAASAGDIIYAFEKTYDECLNITESGLTITGEKKDTTKINCTTGTALNITTDNLRFSNFTFTSFESDYPSINLTGNNAHISNITITDKKNGINIINSGNNILKYININNTTHGINITTSDNTTISKSTFTNSTQNAIDSTAIKITNNTFTSHESSSSETTTTKFENTNNSIIENNTYKNITRAIAIETSKNTNITGNIIKGLTGTSITPITIHNSTQTGIFQNTIDNFNMGLMIEDSDTITINLNTITSITYSPYGTAIQLTQTNNTKITNNTITDSEHGISVYGSSNTNTIYNNTITDIHNISITFEPENTNTFNNIIQKNTITNATIAISMRNTQNTEITQNKIINITSNPILHLASLYLENTNQSNITHNIFDTNTGWYAIILKNVNNGLIQANDFNNYTYSSTEFEVASTNRKNTIKNNTITGGHNPIYILMNNESNIADNTITGKSTNIGIRIEYTNFTNITNNTIEYTNSGVDITYYSQNNKINNNTIRHTNENAIYLRRTGASSEPQNPDTIISNNYIQNTSLWGTGYSSIRIENTIRPTISSNTITSSATEAIYLLNTNNATIKNNIINNSDNAGLYLENSQYNNITGNQFKNNDQGIDIKSDSSLNNLWMNNFSDFSNNFRTPTNYYCIMGLDNNYNTSINDDPPLSCSRAFTNSFNDTTIYVNDTIKFTTDTTHGNSSIISLNITINNTNNTMILAGGSSIKGIWNYEFSDTLEPGIYNATLLHYYEEDDDEDTEDISFQQLSFEVTQLNLTTYIGHPQKNINETISIQAIVKDNATQIKNITSEIYWNGTLIDTQTETEYTKTDEILEFYLETNKTERSGQYNVITTAYAGNIDTSNSTFSINYGNATIRINTTPTIIAYNTTQIQYYNITAIGGDLSNITITFESSDTSIINITTQTEIIPYLNATDTWSSSITLEAIDEGNTTITITANITDGKDTTETKDITSNKIKLWLEASPNTTYVTEQINITAWVQDNATEIINVTADIYWNSTNNTILLEYQQESGTSPHTTYMYRKTIDTTQKSGNYTVNVTVYATNTAKNTTQYYINYGNAAININTTPTLIAYNNTAIQYYNITAINGDLINTTVTYSSNDTSTINITTPPELIPYIPSNTTWSSSITLNASGIGTARLTINAAPQNGTSALKTKDIESRKINMTTDTNPKIANITQNITLTAHIQNNVTKITSVKAKIYWNNTQIATLPLSQSDTSGDYSDNTYTYETTTNLTQRSGNYTTYITAEATNNATSTSHYYINYGHINMTISSTPAHMNTGTQKTQYINITAIGGDLKNLTATISIDNTSIMNLSTTENATKNHGYLNASDTWTIPWQLTATTTPNATINITAGAHNTTEITKRKTIHIKKLTLNTSLSPTTINITEDEIYIYANITGNITKIEYVTANITWNTTSKQDITLDFYRHYPSEEKYEYRGTVIDDSTDRSGPYEVFIEAKSDITINTTKTFFVNYGTPTIIFSPDPQKLNVTENRTQEITIKPYNGDLANVTIRLTSYNESILNLSADENPIREIAYIYYTQTSRVAESSNIGTIKSYNLTGISLGTTKISANVTSEQNEPVMKNKTIEVTGSEDTNAPNVTAIWTNSTISTYNLNDGMTIYANISEDSGLKTKIAEITKPDSYKKNMTMIWSGSGITYMTQNPYTNTTLKDNYTIRIHAIDHYDNTNSSETKNFTLTDIYQSTSIITESLYNRGENATITITVRDVNNNPVYSFNTSLNITHQSNTTILLANNQTSTYNYFINTSILGIHNISTNISKDGNTASNTSTFNVTDILNMTYDTTLKTGYPPLTAIRDFELFTYYSRGEAYTQTLNATLYCYNNTEENLEYMPLKKDTDNIYTYMQDSGNPECYPPNSFCKEYSIKANISDAYNNTGTKTFTLTSYCYQQNPQDPGGGDSSGSSSAGIAGFMQNFTETVREYIFGNQTNITTINDFEFSLNKKEIAIEQGKDTTIIATLNNIGETDHHITSTIKKECCNITLDKSSLTLPKKDKQDIRIYLHSSLSTAPKSYMTTITMKSENITKTETIEITITESQLILDLKKLRYIIPQHKKDIEYYTELGLKIDYLTKPLEELKNHIDEAEDHIEKDDLKNLEISISRAKEISDYISLELLKLKTLKWLNDNRYIIIITLIAFTILSYLLIYFIIPYTYMKKELTQLKIKELELKDAEKSVQKQYFMREVDESTFNKLMSEKHSALLDTRSEIKHIEEKLGLLKHGKLNLKEEEHSKYFILNKNPKKQKIKTDTENNTELQENTKSLKEHEYNLIQSTKEAEKNYYSRIITQEELEQISNNNNKKLIDIKNQLQLTELQNNIEHPEKEKKISLISKIKKRYNTYKIHIQKNNIENKIHNLEKKEQTLEQKDRSIKQKEKELKKEVETLKKEDNILKEKEDQATGSE